MPTGSTNAVTAGGGTPTPTQTKEVQATAFPTVVTPDSGYALSQATVTAPANLSAENIKKDVTIAGVTGSFEGAPVGDLTAFIAGTLTDELTISALRPYAFNEYPAKISMTISEGVTAIPNYFAARSNLGTVRLPSTLRSIGTNAFSGKEGVKGTFEIAEGIEEIGDYSFYSRRYDVPLVIPLSVKKLGYNAFYGCVNVIIPENNNIETFGGGCFAYGNVYNTDYENEILHLEKAVTIKSQAFYSGFIPRTVILGENISLIESEGLRSYNTTVKKLIIKATTPPTISTTTSIGFNTDGYEIVVPVGCLAAYQSATNWSQWADHMVEATQ